MRIKQIFYVVVGMVYAIIGGVSILIDSTAVEEMNYDLLGMLFLVGAGIIIYEAIRGED